jgi:hypothetical protein
MALFHCREKIHHATARLGGSKMASCTEENEFCYVPIIEADASTIRTAIFSDLEPNDIQSPHSVLSSHPGGDRMKKIFVTVTGGCAYVMRDTVPQDCEVEIIDFDNIKDGDDFPSGEAREYCTDRGLYELTPTLQR